MRNAFRTLAVLGGSMLLASVAHADGYRSYRVCGGYAFTTCAAVRITVVGNEVTVNVWNLSGNQAASYGTASPAGTIFTGLGFYNLPPGVDAIAGSLTVSGPNPGGGAAGPWSLRNDSRVDFHPDIALNAGRNTGVASGCAQPGQLGSRSRLLQNPCTTGLANVADYVTFRFTITGGSWDPGKTDFVLRGIDGQTGHQVECWTGTNPVSGNPASCVTVSPEPVSMTLLATGLAGLGGMGLLRRRRRTLPVA